MRFVYLDESGISDAKAEPFVVVAGVIVHADKQIKAIEKYLKDMIADYVHPLIQNFTFFHATDLFSGAKIFNRQTYPKELRWKILREICEIPQKFELPVVMGFIPKEKYKATPYRKNWGDRKLAVGAQTLASVCCLIATERYMRKTDNEEVAALIYENNDHAKKSIRVAQRLLKDSEFVKVTDNDLLGQNFREYLPLSRIVESPLFSEKNESSILQVADAMAWAINRKLRQGKECDRFFEPIDKQLIIRPRTQTSIDIPAA